MWGQRLTSFLTGQLLLSKNAKMTNVCICARFYCRKFICIRVDVSSLMCAVVIAKSNKINIVQLVILEHNRYKERVVKDINTKLYFSCFIGGKKLGEI